MEGRRDPLPSKDIDLSTTKTRLACAHSHKRLHRIVCQSADLRVNAIACDLHNQTRSAQAARLEERSADLVKDEEFWPYTSGQIILNASLLASQEMRHFQ